MNNEENPDSPPPVEVWETAWRAKAGELASVRKQLEMVTGTMNAVETAFNTWKTNLENIAKSRDQERWNEAEIKDIKQESRLKLPPIGGNNSMLLKQKPRQKELEKVKEIDRQQKFRPKNSEQKTRARTRSPSKLLVDQDIAGRSTEDFGLLPQNSAFLEKCEGRNEYCVLSDHQRSRIGEKQLSEPVRPNENEEEDKVDRKLLDKSITGTGRKIEISVQNSPCKVKSYPINDESNADEKEEPSKEEEANLPRKTGVPSKISSKSLKASGLSKEFQELFRLLDKEFEKKIKDRKEEEKESEKAKAAGLERGCSHVPKQSSGLYKEFQELFCLLDKQKSYDGRLMDHLDILSDIDDICTVLQMETPLLCKECQCTNSTTNGDDKADGKGKEGNKSQSARTRSESRQTEYVREYQKCSHGESDSENACISVCVKIRQRPLSGTMTHSASEVDLRLSSSCNAQESSVNLSMNAKNFRWSRELEETHRVQRHEEPSRLHGRYGDRVSGNAYSPRFQHYESSFNPASSEKSPRSLNVHIKEILLELPPIPNDIKKRGAKDAGVYNDLCGWLGRYPGTFSPEFERLLMMDTRKDTRDPLYLKQKYGSSVTWNTKLLPIHNFGAKKNFVQSNRSPRSKSKTKGDRKQAEGSKADYAETADINIIKLCQKENEKVWIHDQSEVKDANEVVTKLTFIDLDELPCKDVKKREFAALPPLKGNGVCRGNKSTTKEKKVSFGLKVEQRKAGEKEDGKKVPPIKEILKPLPPMKAKVSSQMMNWTQKNVGPLKVPPLDLKSLQSSERDHTVTYVTDMVQTPPTSSTQAHDMPVRDIYDIQVEEKLPSDNMLKYHFRRRADDDNIGGNTTLSNQVLGKKIEFENDYEKKYQRAQDNFSQKNYRLGHKRNDVPMDLVRIALKANSLNKGYNDVSNVLKESKKCKTLFSQETTTGPSHCRRLNKKPTRKGSGRPRLQRFNTEIQSKMKEDMELQMLRARLRDCVREKAAERVSGWYSKYDEQRDVPESARSAIARPCSPDSGSNRTPRQ